MIRYQMELLYFLFVLINIYTTDTEYLQKEVKGFVGCSVLLPCASSEKDQNLKVLWRHNDTDLLTIINGNISVEHQKLKFGGRTEIFPKEFMKGNFTLKLHTLTHADAGMYHCFIQHSSEFVTVRLVVNGSTDFNSNSTVKGRNDTERVRDKSISLALVLVVVFIGIGIVILCIVAGVMKIGFKSKVFKTQSNTPKANSLNHPDNSEIPSNGIEQHQNNLL